ncbi:hypothetical protein KDK_59760 [Dictyobacter kobayashii]|uniref:Uncharacterized protein n=2 Tax=Dictyobacter kobayashii TaxID=2014872 RepID=A0A402AST1_9CHLR|nr:hypothetical protein KDK_59760 [Dictyobacter kobayashii]
MNGGVTPIVAGELAHGAFQHGFEAYAVDILERLYALGKQYGSIFHSVYTGAFPASQRPHFQTLDISQHANIDVNGAGSEGVPGWIGEGDNDLHEVPYGWQEMAGIPFVLPDPQTNGRRAAIGISNRAGYASSVRIPVQKSAETIYFLHTVSQTEADGVAGTITVQYEDGSMFARHVVRGYNVQGWWLPQVGDQRVTHVAWRGKNAHCLNVGLLAYGLQNPFPEKCIDSITLTAAQGAAFWGVLGITLSDQPVSFPVSPISYGIPDGWATSAVIYALIEGLAGVVDQATGYSHVAVSPRWSAAGVQQVHATVRYPASHGYVAYHYAHDIEQHCITIEFTGSGERCDFHVLLPKGVTAITSVTDGTKPIAYAQVEIEQSIYADFHADLHPRCQVSISYR